MPDVERLVCGFAAATELRRVELLAEWTMSDLRTHRLAAATVLRNGFDGIGAMTAAELLQNDACDAVRRTAAAAVAQQRP